MENFLEIYMVIVMLLTAGMMIALNILDTKKEKEEARLKEAREAHEEVKKRWNEESLL